MEYLPTVILRHRRENLKKCTLTGLEKRPDFKFYTYPYDTILELPSYIMLSFEGPLLSKEDAGKGLFILDGTWRYADKMYKSSPLLHTIEKRSLPDHFKTAYPRKQDDCSDVGRGLSSIEAIYIAYSILGYPTEGLFENYMWNSLFFERNPNL
ncbi:MAG TPA: DTW domain-containing protein [Parachlamydiaceae bacterium]|nr:DTW domain-containing protein [Parachlamydiaceae bacterium]